MNRATAEKIADALMTDGQGQKADRLLLVDAGITGGTGRCRGSVVDTILREAAAPHREDGEGDAHKTPEWWPSEQAKQAKLEGACRFAIALGYATGHADTFDDLVAHVREQRDEYWPAASRRKLEAKAVAAEALQEHHDETVRQLRKTENERDDAYNLLVRAGWVPHWGLKHAEEVIEKLISQPPASDTESADTLTAGSDNRDVEQVDCTEGSADEWNTPRIVEEKPGLNACHFQGRVMTPEEAIAILVRQRASIAAEERKPLVDAAEDALTVCASCAHERWYQRLWEAVRGEPWTGGPASEDSPIGLTLAEFDQCIADADAEARRGVVEMIQKHFYEIADMQPDERPRVLHVLNALVHDISALAAPPEEARDDAR